MASNKKQRIINTAITLLVEKGLHGTSMSLLAKEAGIATGSIYTYFASKEAMVNEIFQTIIDEELAFLTQNYVAQQSVKQRFEYLLKRALMFQQQAPKKFQFLYLYAFSPVIMKEIQQNNVCPTHPFWQVLTDGKAQGLIRNIDNETLIYQIFGGLTSVLSWRLFCQQPLAETESLCLIDMAWQAVAIPATLNQFTP